MFNSTQVITLTAAVATGLLLGTFYFAGLWWTVRRMPDVRRPLNLYFGSLVGRLGVILAALYGVLISCGWPGLAASLVGLLAARIILIRFLGKARPADSPTQKAA